MRGEGAEEREGEEVEACHSVWTRAHMTNLLGHVIHIVPDVL